MPKAICRICEERHGEAEVERLLDAAHALMAQGVHHYPRKKSLDWRSEEKRDRERMQERERLYNDLWRTVPGRSPQVTRKPLDRQRAMLALPQENILYFLEKFAPKAAAVAAGGAAHRQADRAIFLPAASDQGHERGLRNLLPLPHHEQAT